MGSLMKKSLVCGLAILSLLFVGQCADKPTVPNILETTLSGKVLDAGTGAPIAGAIVSSEPTSEQINVEVGYQKSVRKFKDRSRSAQDIDYSRVFLRMIAGLRPLF